MFKHNLLVQTEVNLPLDQTLIQIFYIGVNFHEIIQFIQEKPIKLPSLSTKKNRKKLVNFLTNLTMILILTLNNACVHKNTSNWF